MPDQNPQRTHAWHDGLRTVVLYVLTGVIGWVGLTISQQSSAIADQSKSIVKLQVQIESMQKDNTAVVNQLAVLPVMSREVDKIQLEVDSHERRITELEQVRKLK